MGRSSGASAQLYHLQCSDFFQSLFFMKKLLFSFLMISAVTSSVVFSTSAFFSDTEASNDNTFTSGSIDLRVDSQSSYNGYVCEEGKWNCDAWGDAIISLTQGLRKNNTPVVAERSNPLSALGAPQNNDTINFLALGFGGEAVMQFHNMIMNGPGNDIRVYETTFGNQSYAQYPEGADVFASQDGVTWQKLGAATQDELFDLENAQGGVMAWARYLKFVDTSLKSSGLFNGETDGYDLDGVEALHSNCDPEFLQDEACGGNWESKDLTIQDRFFDFQDLKPGDHGSNSISMEVFDNDAYACLYVQDVENNDLEASVPEMPEPESNPLEGNDSTPGADNGELADYLHFFLWRDDGDNAYEADEEKITAVPVLANTFLANAAFTLFDFLSGPIPGEETRYVGMAWCVGEMMVNDLAIVCNGENVGNDAQTDELKATIALYAEQARNNDEFTCVAPEVEEE